MSVWLAFQVFSVHSLDLLPNSMSIDKIKIAEVYRWAHLWVSRVSKGAWIKLFDSVICSPVTFPDRDVPSTAMCGHSPCAHAHTQVQSIPPNLKWLLSSALGPLGFTWTKHYCTYDKGSKMFTMSVSDVKASGKMVSELSPFKLKHVI